MIDKLIAQEKHNANYGSDMCGQLKSEARCAPPMHEKDPMYGVGPLGEPAMASTLRGEYLGLLQGHMGHGGYPRKEEFTPMQPDSTHSSLQSPPHTPHMNTYSPEAPMYNGHMQEHKPQPYGPHSDIPLDAAQFTSYYQQLTPAERKRQLLAQKEALLSEQRRLRHVLSEQEALLRSKQEQLHRQQQRQRERLSFFQQAGYFPPSSTNGHSLNTSEASYQNTPGMPAPPPYPQNAMPNGVHHMGNMGYGHPSTSSAPMGYQPPATPHPAQTDYHQPMGPPPHMGHRPYYPEQGGDIYPPGHGYGLHYSPGAHPPHAPPHMADGMSDSMENLHFLERHGINVAHMRREQRKGKARTSFIAISF